MIYNMFVILKDKDSLTSIGIVITIFISSISLYFSVRNNKAVHYENSVTKSRIKWIQELRNTVAEFIANTNIYNNVYYKTKYEKTGVHLSECQQLCSKIKLLLNACDKRDIEIIELSAKNMKDFRIYCDSVNNCIIDRGYFVESPHMKHYKAEVEDNIEKLSEKVQIYLKAEWNRVKYESQGKVYEKDTQRFDYEVLEKKYKDFSYECNVWERFYIDIKAKIRRIKNSPIVVISTLLIVVLCIIVIIA